MWQRMMGRNGWLGNSIGTYCAVLVAGGSVAVSIAAEPPAAMKMRSYQFVMLKGTAKESEITEAQAGEMMKQHLAGLEALVNDGRAVAVGPLEGDPEIRGVLILAVADQAEAQKALADDPFVKSGALRVEAHTWWGAEGVTHKPPAFLDTEPLALGFLLRPVDAPQFEADKLAELQKGHLANIQRMAASGDLVWAGPFDADTPLRGILLFRHNDRARIESLVANDPALQAHRLELRLMTWRISKGVFAAK